MTLPEGLEGEDDGKKSERKTRVVPPSKSKLTFTLSISDQKLFTETKLFTEYEIKRVQLEKEYGVFYSKFESRAQTSSQVLEDVRQQFQKMHYALITKYRKRAKEGLSRKSDVAYRPVLRTSTPVLAPLRQPEHSQVESKKKDNKKSKRAPKVRANFDPAQTAVLRTFFFQNFDDPYPSDQRKSELAMQTNLKYDQVSNWFINARMRMWKPMVKKIKKNKAQQDKNQFIYESSITQKDLQKAVQLAMKRQLEEGKEVKEIKESSNSQKSAQASQSFSKEHSNLITGDLTYDLTWNSQEQVTQQLPTQFTSLSVSSLPISDPIISAPSSLVDSFPPLDPSLSRIQSRSLLVDSSLPILQSPPLLMDDTDFGLSPKQMDFSNDLVSTSRESVKSSTEDSLFDFEDFETIRDCDDFPESGIWDTFYSETTPNISGQGYS